MPLTANKNDNKDRAVPELGIPPVDKPEAEVPEVKPAQAAADEAPAAQPEAAPAARPAKKWAAVISFVITVLAWVALPFNEVATLVLGVAGLITSIIALRQPRGAWRNLTLVAIVAAAVLLLVLAIFWGGILFALGSL